MRRHIYISHVGMYTWTIYTQHVCIWRIFTYASDARLCIRIHTHVLYTYAHTHTYYTYTHLERGGRPRRSSLALCARRRRAGEQAVRRSVRKAAPARVPARELALSRPRCAPRQASAAGGAAPSAAQLLQSHDPHVGVRKRAHGKHAVHVSYGVAAD